MTDTESLQSPSHRMTLWLLFIFLLFALMVIHPRADGWIIHSPITVYTANRQNAYSNIILRFNSSEKRHDLYDIIIIYYFCK